jgi:hypothetical protein
MRYSQQTMLGIVLVVVIGTSPVNHFASLYLQTSTQYCIFHIEKDSTITQVGVENKKNWLYRQRYSEKAVFPKQGNYFASHLIVDIRDTDTVYATNTRKLKDNVMIVASRNKDRSHWIVREYHVEHSSFHDIRNE